MLVPEFSEHAPDRARDVIAVLAIFGDSLNANPARIELHELPHAVRHHADPVFDAAARVVGERAQQHANEIGVAQQIDVRRIALDVRGERRKRFGGVAIGERTQKCVEQFRFSLRRCGAIVFDRVRDAAEQIRGHHRAAEHAGEKTNRDCECARNFGEHGAREPRGVAEPLGAIDVRRVRVHRGGRGGPSNASSRTCAVVGCFVSANSRRSSACSIATCARETRRS